MLAAQHPFNLWPLAFVALIPAVFAVEHLRLASTRHILLASLALLPFWIVTHLYTIEITVAAYVPFNLVVVGIYALAILADCRIRNRMPSLPRSVVFPLAWTGIDYFRGEIAADGYAWGFASHPLVEWWPAAAPGAVVGAYGVTFLLALLAGATIDAVQRRRKAWMIAVAMLTLSWVASIWMVANVQEGSSVRVAMLQTNVPQSNKVNWTIERELTDWREMRALMNDVVEARVGFAVWPETMIPGMTISPDAVEALREKEIVFKTTDGSGIRATVFADDLAEVQRQSGIPLIVGDQAIDDLRITDTGSSISFQDAGKFNSVFVVDQGMVSTERYDKIHLTPFGEIMPGIRRWPWLQDNLLSVGATGMKFELTPGTKPTVLRIRDALSSTPREIRFAAPICYECSDSPLVRTMVFENGVRRADLLAFVTNDGWFGSLDFMRRQHLQLARWRCLELATPGVRAANTGICAIIDARGRLVRSGTDAEPATPRVSGILSGEVNLGVSRTPVALFGQPIGWASLGSLSALLLLTWIRPAPSRTNT